MDEAIEVRTPGASGRVGLVPCRTVDSTGIADCVLTQDTVTLIWSQMRRCVEVLEGSTPARSSIPFRWQLRHLPALVCRGRRRTLLRLPGQHPSARARLASAHPRDALGASNQRTTRPSGAAPPRPSTQPNPQRTPNKGNYVELLRSPSAWPSSTASTASRMCRSPIAAPASGLTPHCPR